MSAESELRSAIDAVEDAIGRAVAGSTLSAESTHVRMNIMVVNLLRAFARLNAVLLKLIDRLQKASEGAPPDDLGPITPWALGAGWSSGGQWDSPPVAGYTWDEWERRRKKWREMFGSN